MRLEEKTSKLAIDDQAPATPPSESSGVTPPAEPVSAAKSRRVRTGCLTCRERHLKCDEGMPICQNCRKSSRACKRGVRLNFIDTKVEDTQLVPPSADWSVNFQDESRDIASEYKGGAGRYATVSKDEMGAVTSERRPPAEQQQQKQQQQQQPQRMPQAPVMAHQPLPPMQSPPAPNNSYSNGPLLERRRDSLSTTTSTHSGHSPYQSPSPHYQSGRATTPSSEARDCITSPEETLFMQVFVEEVGLWMDSMDPHKHFSRILPFYALAEPMLLNAFLACGARHLSLVNPAFHADRALHFYDTATKALLRQLQNANRDTIICATAAVILNVYEVMTERALQRMNHIAGARALIKECGWSARSVGIGAACFWLNVGMELLSCLHFNWQVAWNPDEWGVDMNMQKDTRAGQEEAWTHKILYICAKVANFRASIPRFPETNPATQAMRVQERAVDWEMLKALCDKWNENIPRTMHPAAYLLPHQTSSNSTFPEVWLIKRTSIMARLFYHTAMCLLPQMHPLMPLDSSQEMVEMQMHHAHMICGIVAHNKDRGVASAAIRCIGIAAECLTDYKEQSEILSILKKVKKETGWKINGFEPELRVKWRWTDEYVRQQEHLQNMMQSNGNYNSHDSQQLPPVDFPFTPPHQSSQPSPPLSAPLMPPLTASASPNPSVASSAPGIGVPPSTLPQIPRGIVNPTMRMADFNAPMHAYQNYWVAPNQHHNDAHYFYRLLDGNYH